MNAVETARAAELRTLAGLAASGVHGWPDPHLARLLPVLVSAALEAELVLIRIVELTLQGATAGILLIYYVRLNHMLAVLVSMGWFA